VDRWCAARGVERGAVLPLEQCWRLSLAWYAGRHLPGWRRRNARQARAVFESVGLTGDFWRLE
jgi:hypothetical protein